MTADEVGDDGASFLASSPAALSRLEADPQKPSMRPAATGPIQRRAGAADVPGTPDEHARNIFDKTDVVFLA